MELGRTKLPRHGANVLRQALHPVHGLAWTDGRRVMLACLKLRGTDSSYKDGIVDTAVGTTTPPGAIPPASPTSCSLLDTSIIGTFEHVWDLCWGASCCPGSAALLAVQHKRHATVWLLRRVGSHLPTDPAAKGHDPCANLLVSQTCEMALRQPILPQGCVWHPSSDALAVLTDDEVWLLPAARQGNSRIRVPLPHHQHHHQHQRPRHPCCPQAVRCAAWSEGGRRLVVAAGESILLYEWDKARRVLAPCAACPVFHLGGFASVALPVGESLLAVALEAPGSAAAAAAPTLWPHVKLAGGRMMASSQVSLTPGIEPGLHGMKHRGSVDSSHSVESVYSPSAERPSSTLLLVSFDGSRGTCGTRRVFVPGGLAVPDLAAFEPRSGTLALASNAAGTVSLFTLGPLGLVAASGTVRLASEEKVKGVCFVGERTLLLASGTLRRQGDASLVSQSSPPPFSHTSKYSLRIVARDLPTPRAAEDERSASMHSTVSSSRSSLNYMQVNADSKGEDDMCAPVSHDSWTGSPTPGDSEPALPQGKRSKGVLDGQGQEHGASQTYFTKLLMNVEHPCDDLRPLAGKLTSSPRPLSPHPRLHRVSREDLGAHGKLCPSHGGYAGTPAAAASSPSLRCSPRGSVCGSLNNLFMQLRQNVQRLNSDLTEVTVHLADRPDLATAGAAAGGRAPSERPNRRPARRPQVDARDPQPAGRAAPELDARGSGPPRGSAWNGPRDGPAEGTVDEGEPFPVVEHAEWVRVTCQNGPGGNETRIFLLTGRRLHLGVIKEVFALGVAEIQAGETWMILGADENNFIPLTFDPGTEVVVREGRRRIWHGKVPARDLGNLSSEA